MHLEGDPESPGWSLQEPNRIWLNAWSAGPISVWLSWEEDLCGFILKAILQAAAWNVLEFTMKRECRLKREWEYSPGFLWIIFHWSRRRRRTSPWSGTSWEFHRKDFHLKEVAWCLKNKRKRGNVVDFHTRHKLLSFHSPNIIRPWESSLQKQRKFHWKISFSNTRRFSWKPFNSRQL